MRKKILLLTMVAALAGGPAYASGVQPNTSIFLNPGVTPEKDLIAWPLIEDTPQNTVASSPAPTAVTPPTVSSLKQLGGFPVPTGAAVGLLIAIKNQNMSQATPDCAPPPTPPACECGSPGTVTWSGWDQVSGGTCSDGSAGGWLTTPSQCVPCPPPPSTTSSTTGGGCGSGEISYDGGCWTPGELSGLSGYTPPSSTTSGSSGSGGSGSPTTIITPFGSTITISGGTGTYNGVTETVTEETTSSGTYEIISNNTGQTVSYNATTGTVTLINAANPGEASQGTMSTSSGFTVDQFGSSGSTVAQQLANNSSFTGNGSINGTSVTGISTYTNSYQAPQNITNEYQNMTTGSSNLVGGVGGSGGSQIGTGLGSGPGGNDGNYFSN